MLLLWKLWWANTFWIIIILFPVVNVSDALTVKIKLKLSQLIDVNLKNQIMTTNLWVEQSWFDYKLKWEPREYGGVEMLHVPSDHIWRPDIVVSVKQIGNNIHSTWMHFTFLLTNSRCFTFTYHCCRCSLFFWWCSCITSKCDRSLFYWKVL